MSVIVAINMQSIKEKSFFSFLSLPQKLLFLVLSIHFMTGSMVFAQKGQAFTLEINGIVKDDDNGRAIDGATVKVTTADRKSVV